MIAALAGAALPAAPGNLQPQAPPAPTMKTMQEVSPCIPVRAASLPLFINVPGHWCLVEDVATSGAGITINASDVRLDLGGFSLAGGTGIGIFVAATADRVTIENGTVIGWGDSGIEGLGLRMVVSGVSSSSNGTRGIRVGPHSQVRDSAAIANGTGGITVGDAGSVRDSVASLNGTVGFSLAPETRATGVSAVSNTGTGIIASSGAAIFDSLATFNGAHGISLESALAARCVTRKNGVSGIVAIGGSVVESCVAAQNGTSGGIDIDVAGSRVSGCSVQADETGIRVGSDSVIADNRIGAGAPGAGIGIEIAGFRSRIDGNEVTQKQTGYLLTSSFTGNVVIRNSAAGNTINFSLDTSGNSIGPIGNAATATSPWVNLAH